MHDIKAIRENPAAFDAGLKRRGIFGDGAGQFSVEAILKLDERRRAHVTKLQDVRARRNAASKEIGKAKGAKDEATAARLMTEVADLKDELAAGEVEEKRITREIEAILEVIPNLPRDDVPEGADETANVQVRKAGTPRTFHFKPKQHFEIGEALGMMDFESAAKVSGARFVYLTGGLARLERALGAFMLDIHTEEFGYTEVNPPLLVRDEAMFGTGNLPKFADQLFFTDSRSSDFSENTAQWIKRAVTEADIPDAGMSKSEIIQLLKTRSDYAANAFAIVNQGEHLEGWSPREGAQFVKLGDRYGLIPTAEVSLTNLVREQIVDEDTLPRRYTAWTPCFRSEAGSAGRDVRGMIRQHQFSKVELVSITTPETSLAEHERMTKCAETILERLELPFRTMLLCTGDMGFASQKTYDIEVWLPGQDAYREISSCSVCGDFQARRMGARYRPKGSKDSPAAGGQPKGKQEPRFVHTLNGSGLAVGRTLIAVLENYQQADGSIAIPEALRPYMRGRDRIAKA